MPTTVFRNGSLFDGRRHLGPLGAVVVADKLAAVPEVDYVVICAGGFDLLVELVCTDDAHLLDLLNDKIRTVEGVAATETFMYLKLAKQTYAWGTR